MAPVTFAVAGAGGLLGGPIIAALTAANHPVIILTRSESRSALKLPSSSLITIKEVDFKSLSSLTAALQGVDVVVSCLASAALPDQITLVEAAVQAGVQRFIPSEFGSDTSNPANNVLPVYKHKAATAEKLKDLAAQNPGFSYTLVFNQLFLDDGLERGFIIHPATHTARIFDRGDVRISVTTLPTVAKAVTSIIAKLEETRNRVVYIHDTTVTQNQLVNMVKEIDGKEWDLTQVNTADLQQKSYEALQRGEEGKMVMSGFIPGAVYGRDSGGDFTGKTDNELLGLGMMSEEELKRLVRGVVEGGGKERMW